MSVLVLADSSESKLCAPSEVSMTVRQFTDMGTTSREPQSDHHDAAPSSTFERGRVSACPVDDMGDSAGNEHEEVHDLESDSDTEENLELKKSFLISPNVPLKDQLERDKDDESLRRWKEQLLGSIQDLLDPVQESEIIEPEVRVLDFTVLSDGRPEMVIPLPLASAHRGHLFSLKEGCSYKIRFTFSVRRNIVSGLKYIHTVWKNGFKVENIKTMLGTFGPQSTPYIHTMDEETTPSGIFARGSYTSRIRFVDDDGRSHLDVQHTFAISKDW